MKILGRKRMNSESRRDAHLRRELIGVLPRLRRMARSLTRDPDKADDLVQEACERALTRSYQYREKTRLDSWLYRIIYTRWIDEIRKERTRSNHVVVLDDGTTSSMPPNQENVIPETLDIRAALDVLLPEQRAALVLVSVDGYSYEEAAEVLQVPAGTVASRVARARKIMGKILDYRKKRKTQSTTSR